MALLTPMEVSPLPLDLGLTGDLKIPGRPEITWDTVCVGEVFSPRALQFSAKENARYCFEIGDDDPIYAELIHPHYLLSLANEALMQEYQMPAWIHVKSKPLTEKPASGQRGRAAQCGHRPMGKEGPSIHRHPPDVLAQRRRRRGHRTPGYFRIAQ